MQSVDTDTETEKPLKPIPEKILSYFEPYVNDMFCEDGVGYDTQVEFEIGYDEFTNRITIPIRDDLGNLVGVKARYFYRQVPEDEQKFIQPTFYVKNFANSIGTFFETRKEWIELLVQNENSMSASDSESELSS